MAKKQRKQELVEKTLAYKLFGKRYSELSKEEIKQYWATMMSERRKDNPEIRAKETAYMREYRRRKREDAKQ